MCETKKQCQTCKFWNELIARAIPGGGTFAPCFAGTKGMAGDGFMRETDSCESWAGGDPIDDPRRGQPESADDEPAPDTLLSRPVLESCGVTQRMVSAVQQMHRALMGCADMLKEAAKQFRLNDDTGNAELCVLHEDRARAAVKEAKL